MLRNNIKAIRERQGMTQADLAQRTGVGVPQVSKWENGMVNIPMARLAAIAEALGVREDLLTRTDYVVPGRASLGPIGGPEDWQGEQPGTITARPRGQVQVRNAVVAKDDGDGIRVGPNASVIHLEGASVERMQDNLPVYGTALGAAREVDGEAIEQVTLNQGEVISYAKRPVLLNGNASAYALYVTGHSMEPRHMDGDMLVVDPKGRVRIMDDVVVYLRPDNPEMDDGQAARGVLVKRLLRRTAGYIELEQFQPAKHFRIETSDIVRIDRVVPWQELLA